MDVIFKAIKARVKLHPQSWLCKDDVKKYP